MPDGAVDVDRKLLEAIERLSRALRAARQQIATGLGLTTLQTEILGCVDDLGPLPIGRLARELDITQPTVSDAIATLERKQLVERHRSPHDGRITVTHLTDAGRGAAASIGEALALLHPARAQPGQAERGIALRVILEEILRLQRTGIIDINRSCLSCPHYHPPAGTDPAHCLLLDTPLQPSDLRVDCPDHERPPQQAAGRASKPAGQRRRA